MRKLTEGFFVEITLLLRHRTRRSRGRSIISNSACVESMSARVRVVVSCLGDLEKLHFVRLAESIGCNLETGVPVDVPIRRRSWSGIHIRKMQRIARARNPVL